MSVQEPPQGKHQEPPQEECGSAASVSETDCDKPKRQLTEEQLRNLARGRKIALEARKAKAIVRHAGKLKEKMAVAEAFNQEVEEAKATIEHARPKEKELSPPPAPAAIEHESSPRPKKDPKEPSPKERYYLLKLQRLEAEMQEQQARAQYAAAPPRVHAYDVARGALKARADRAVYENVYRDMFGGMG